MSSNNLRTSPQIKSVLSPIGDETINLLPIGVIAPLLITFAVFANGNMLSNIIAILLGLGVIGYHGMKLFNTGKLLYLFHVIVGILILLTGFYPTGAGYMLIGALGVAAIVVHSYLIYLKSQ